MPIESTDPGTPVNTPVFTSKGWVMSNPSPPPALTQGTAPDPSLTANGFNVPAPSPAPPVSQMNIDYSGISNVDQWAQAELAYLGVPVTPNNVQFLVAWANQEGGNWNNTAHFNPLNTTLRLPGSSVMGGGNIAGVQAYGSWQQGIQATAQTLQNYPQIMAALKAGNAATANTNGQLAGDLHKWSGGGYTMVTAGPFARDAPKGGGGAVLASTSTAAGAGAVGGGGGAAAMQTPADTTIGQLGIAEAQQKYPELAWMLTIPDAAADINQFAAKHYTPDEIAAQLQGKDWYQRLGASFFTWVGQQATNPTQAAQTFQEELVAVKQTFAQLGLKPSDQQLQTFAYQALAEDWQNHPELQQQAIADIVHANPDGTFSVRNYTVDASGRQVNTFIGPDGKPTAVSGDFQTKLPTSYIANGLVTQVGSINAKGRYTGQAVGGGAPVYAEIGGQLVQGFDIKKLAPGTTLYTLPNYAPAAPGATGAESSMAGQLQAAEQTFKATAADYLVPISDGAAAQLVQQAVSSGTTDVATFAKTYFQAQAKSLYPTMAAAIDAGITPKAYTDPYRQIVSQLLGVSPDSVNMMDPKYMRFVTQKDPKSGMPTAMSLYDAQQMVMSDPTYGYMHSQSAKDRASALAQGIGEMFGKVPAGSGTTGFAAMTTPKPAGVY